MITVFTLHLQDFPENLDILKRFPNLTRLQYRSHPLSTTYPDMSGYHGNLVTIKIGSLKKGEVKVCIITSFSGGRVSMAIVMLTRAILC